MDIERLDIVCVNFNASQFTLSRKAEVIRRPWEVGEPWVFKDVESGEIHETTEPCTITLIQKWVSNG